MIKTADRRRKTKKRAGVAGAGGGSRGESRKSDRRGSTTSKRIRGNVSDERIKKRGGKVLLQRKTVLEAESWQKKTRTLACRKTRKKMTMNGPGGEAFERLHLLRKLELYSTRARGEGMTGKISPICTKKEE